MSKYKIGDELRIREWDDMEAEYPHSSYGTSINGDYYSFIKQMRHLCGKDFTVSDIERIRGTGHIVYHSYEKVEYDKNPNGWCIQEYMLEPRTAEELYIASDSEINELLFVR